MRLSGRSGISLCPGLASDGNTTCRATAVTDAVLRLPRKSGHAPLTQLNFCGPPSRWKSRQETGNASRQWRMPRLAPTQTSRQCNGRLATPSHWAWCLALHGQLTETAIPMGELVQPEQPRPAFSLDELYLMLASIYGEQNSQRPISATFAHFVEVCGMLSVHDRKKKREEFEVEDALCKSLGWCLPLMAKMRVTSVEELVFRKFPYACPYCRTCPHNDSKCKTVQGTKRTVDHEAVRRKYDENAAKRPRALNTWQLMFAEIYPRNVDDVGKGRSTVGLLEELGELAEAVRVFEKHPKYFAGEAADVFSYIMGIANEHALKMQIDGQDFDFESEFLQRYPGLCLQCGYEVCICPSVPESTVGRLSKELDLAAVDDLFRREAATSERRGREIAGRVLERVGGLRAIS